MEDNQSNYRPAEFHEVQIWFKATPKTAIYQDAKFYVVMTPEAAIEYLQKVIDARKTETAETSRPLLHKQSPLAAKPKKPRKKKSNRKILEKQIADLVKLIICWRDGQRCVFGELDGTRCGNGLMWNHFIAQKQSHWLQIDLGNVTWGCGSHNFLDKHGDKTYSRWYVKNLGEAAMDAISLEAAIHKGKKRSVPELEVLLAHYEELYQNRYYVNLETDALVKAGYFGEIVRAAW